MEPPWPRRCTDGVAAADTGAVLALRGRRAVGLAGRIRCDAAVPGGRCRAPSCVAGCVGVGAAVQQRRDERRRGGNRCCRASVRVRRRRGRVDTPAGRLPFPAGAVRGSAAVAAVRPRAARGAPDSRRRGSRLGAAAVGGRRHRSAAVHRLPLDPAWHRSPGSRAGGDLAWKRARGGSRAICAGHDGGTRGHRTSRGRPLRTRCRTSRCSSA